MTPADPRVQRISGQVDFDGLVARCATGGTATNQLGKRVLKLLCESDRPLGAYELASLLNAGDTRKQIVPNSVYRVLRALGDCGVVMQIESTRAFMVCGEGTSGDRLVCVCEGCGTVVLVTVLELGRQIRTALAASGFKLRRPIFEAQGLCTACVTARQ